MPWMMELLSRKPCIRLSDTFFPAATARVLSHACSFSTDRSSQRSLTCGRWRRIHKSLSSIRTLHFSPLCRASYPSSAGNHREGKHTKPQPSSPELVSKRENRSKEVLTRTKEAGIVPAQSKKKLNDSPRRRSIVFQADGKIKRTLEFVESTKSSSKNVASPKLVSTRNQSARVGPGSLEVPHSSPLQVEREKVESSKRMKVKESSAMEEANGYRMSKRGKKNPEEVQLVIKLNMCSKHGDLHGALDLFDSAKKGGLVDLKQHHYNVLLYICSAAASGSITKRKSGSSDKQQGPETEESTSRVSKGEIENAADSDVVFFSPEDMRLAAKRGTEIYEDMLQAKIPPNEAAFTSVARLAAAKGDGDLAFETVKKMAAANIAPKLRSYGPPLLCFCESNQVERAFEVDDHMLASGVFPDENLLEALLKLSIAAGLDEKVYTLFHRLRTTVREVSPATVLTVEKWFNSKAGSSAGEARWDSPPSEEEVRQAAEAGGGGWHGLGWLGQGKWIMKRTNISKAGVCLSCGERLCTIDLDPEETERFAKSVAKLAFQREHDLNDFVAFQNWLDKHGPFEAVLDGANIGMYNSQGRHFNFHQIASIASSIMAKSMTNKPPLIILHRRRTSLGPPQSPRSENILRDWKHDNNLYSTPKGSNDDWYWLYAAVNCRCLLVTNDEMRDHLFELLGNDFFPKWKERHQVRFTFSMTGGLELHMPPPYSIVIQESQHGSWHIPQAGGDDIDTAREWLCVTRSIGVDGRRRQLGMAQTENADSKVPAGVANMKLVQPIDSDIVGAGGGMPSTLLKLKAAEKLSSSPIMFEI